MLNNDKHDFQRADDDWIFLWNVLHTLVTFESSCCMITKLKTGSKSGKQSIENLYYVLFRKLLYKTRVGKYFKMDV